MRLALTLESLEIRLMQNYRQVETKESDELGENTFLKFLNKKNPMLPPIPTAV